jgi:DNA primase large subunit
LSCIGFGSSLSDTYYKVPFELVGDLIMKRSVFLHKGWAYVPRTESFSILLNIFKSHLEFQLEVSLKLSPLKVKLSYLFLKETAKSIPRLNEEERLLPMLLNICKSSENIHDPVSIGIQNASKLSHSDIEKVTAHFPPCMTHLHSKLKEEAHLKYGGRMQYGLFLKVSFSVHCVLNFIITTIKS